jgi:hypothetical protein
MSRALFFLALCACAPDVPPQAPELSDRWSCVLDCSPDVEVAIELDLAPHPGGVAGQLVGTHTTWAGLGRAREARVVAAIAFDVGDRCVDCLEVAAVELMSCKTHEDRHGDLGCLTAAETYLDSMHLQPGDTWYWNGGDLIFASHLAPCSGLLGR